MRLLLAGATGLVGGHALEWALKDSRVTQVVAPTRRPLVAHDKLLNPLVTMSSLPADAEWWSVDSAVSALGTTRAQAGSAAAFRVIDHDYPLAIARHVRQRGGRCFVLTSAVGASAQSRFFYNRVKGELEDALSEMGFASLTYARPGLLAGQRAEPRFMEGLAGIVSKALDPVLPVRFRANPATAVGAMLVEAAITAAPGTHVITASDIVRFADRRRADKD